MAKRDPTQKLEAPPDFDGPNKNRGCTDLLCTLLLLAMWAAMTYLGVTSIQSGDYRIITNPMDYDGNVCGIENKRGNMTGKDMTEYPYLYYVNLVGGGVCVKECPDLTPPDNPNETMALDPYTLITYAGIFQLEGFSSMDPNFIQVADYSDNDLEKACTPNTCFPNNDPVTAYFADDGINQGYGYAFYVLDTRDFLNRCFPSLESFQTIQNQTGADLIGIEELEDFGFWERFYGDVWTARAWILGFGFGASLVISFLYLFLLQVPCMLEIMVWGSILLTNALIFGGGAYLYLLSNSWATADPQIHTDGDIQTARIISYVLFALGALFFCLMIYLRKEIQLALGTVEETCKALNKMPIISLFPVLECLGILVFSGVWVVYAVFLASLGTPSIETYSNPFNDITVNVRTFEYSDRVIQSAWYLLLCLFWTFQFILSMGEIIVAMSVAKWYFSRDKSTVGNTTVISSICTSLWYHSGTAAFGALILAIIRIFRTILAKIQKEAKAANNKLAEILLCTCQCCMWCLDKFIRFMNKNAFIQTAIFGTSFCTSAREAFFLIARNPGKVAALSYVSEAVSIIGKLFITAATGVASYFAMDHFLGDQLTSLAGPCVLIVIIAYNVADSFMDIFDMGVSTILQCFVADDEMFSEEESFAEGTLKTYIDDWDK